MAFTSDLFIRLRNGGALKAVDAAGTGTVDLLKADSNDKVVAPNVIYIGSYSANNAVATAADVSAAIAGQKPKEAVAAATTSADGNIDLSSDFESTIDGQALADGARYLIKNQTAPEQNGIYTYNSTTKRFTRATDFDSLSPVDEINKAYTVVQAGTQNKGKAYVVSSTVAVLDTDPINFVFFNALDYLSGSNAISVSGGVVSIGIDGTTLSQSASGIKVATGGIANNEIAADAGIVDTKLATISTANKVSGSAVQLKASAGLKNDSGLAIEPADIAGDGVEDDGSDKLRVKLDGSTLSRSASGIKVANAGIGETQLDASKDSGKVNATSFVMETGYSKADTTIAADTTIQAAVQALDYRSDNIKQARQEVLSVAQDDTYVDLALLAQNGKVSVSPVGGPVQRPGTDYTTSTEGGVTRITFAGDLAAVIDISPVVLIVSYMG